MSESSSTKIIDEATFIVDQHRFYPNGEGAWCCRGCDWCSWYVTEHPAHVAQAVLDAIGYEALVETKDAAYRERNELVGLLSKLYPSHLAEHTGDEWEDEWRTIVCVHTPWGQASWHVHWGRDHALFSHLEYTGDDWDGHTTEQKYDRLRAAAVIPQIDPNAPT